MIKQKRKSNKYLPTIPTHIPQNKFANPTVRPAPKIICPRTKNNERTPQPMEAMMAVLKKIP